MEFIGTFMPLSSVQSLGNRFPLGNVGIFVPVTSVRSPRELLILFVPLDMLRDRTRDNQGRNQTSSGLGIIITLTRVDSRVSSVLLRDDLLSASLDDQVLSLGCNIDRTRILRQKSD